MAKSSVGIILRSKSVEVFEAQRGPRGFRVTKRAIEPIHEAEQAGPSAASSPGQAAVVQALRMAVGKAGVKTTQVGVSVSSSDVLLRSFTLPLLPAAERETAVQFEVRKYLPFKTSELIWNFHAIERPSAKQLAVVFVGIRTDTFTKIQGWLNDAGITPSHIEAQWVSLARLAPETSSASEHQCVGIVEVEGQQAHIVIAKDQAPFLARDVNLKVDLSTITHAAQTGSSTTPAGHDPRAEVLLSELRLSMDFFTRENPAASIGQVLVFGDPDVVEPWCAWFASQLPCPVTMGTLPVEGDPRQSANQAFACGAGLALRELQPARARLDFQVQGRSAPQPGFKVPWAQWPRLAEWLSQGQLTGFIQAIAKPLAFQGIIALAALIAAGVFSQQQLDKKRRELMTLTQGLAETGWGLQGKSKEELEALQAQVNTRLTVLRETIQQRLSVAEKLDALAKALPEGVWLENLAYQDPVESPGPNRPSLTIQGACFLPHAGGELRVISDFIHSIKEQPRFFRGFTATKLGQIEVKEDHMATQAYSYRTFALNCESEATTLKRGERIQ